MDKTGSLSLNMDNFRCKCNIFSEQKMDFPYEDYLQMGEDTTSYRLLTKDFVSTVEVEGRTFLKVDPAGLRLLAETAMADVSFKLRPAHLEQVRAILDDPEASDNDRFVAYNMLENAVVAAQGQLPTCQDTGTAIVFAKKGEQVLTFANDAKFLSEGIWETYTKRNLRYSQMVATSMLQETNSKCNLPAQVDILSIPGDEYKFMFVAKGGGSANKTYLFQETPAILTEKNLEAFLTAKLKSLGTAACPPYHLAVVIGGTSAETNLKLVKLASCKYLDGLPTSGNASGRVFRDLEWEERLRKIARESGIGAQFGGKCFVHDVRVLRCSRHSASCPIGIGVSCSADRNIKAKITKDGIFLEQMEENPARLLPPPGSVKIAEPVKIDLDRPMKEICAELSKHPVKTRLSLSGTMIVARDLAHKKIAEMLDSGKPMPDYFKNHPVYYAGPAKTPEGMPTGSFGPTTAGRMDGYVDRFQELGGSMVMVAKGNRSQQVTDACKKHGGFYLGSIGQPAAILAKNCIKSVEVLDFPEMGMEAVRKIRIENFPAFILVDDKGNNFFDGLL